MKSSCLKCFKGTSCGNIQHSCDLPRRRSSRLAGELADNVCLPNYKPELEVVWKAPHEKKKPTDESVVVQRCLAPECKHKTPESLQPEQTHSAPSGGPHPISPLGLDGGFEASSYLYRHGARTTDSKEGFERSQRLKINIPSPNDKKAWSELNAILSDILPRRFPNNWIRSTKSDRISAEFDNFLYDFLVNAYSVIPPPAVPSPNAANGIEKH